MFQSASNTKHNDGVRFSVRQITHGLSFGLGFAGILLLAGCSAISIPLGDVFGQQTQRATPPTVSSVPVSAVTTTSLAPLPPIQRPVIADPITTGSITPDPLPYRNTLGAGGPTGTPRGVLAASGLASIPSNANTALLLPAEDEDLLRGALASAFLDQERAATVPWLNDKNGDGGLIVPVGSPQLQAGGICRAVIISVQRRTGPSEWLQANACREADGSWALLDQRPWRNPA